MQIHWGGGVGRGGSCPSSVSVMISSPPYSQSWRAGGRSQAACSPAHPQLASMGPLMFLISLAKYFL